MKDRKAVKETNLKQMLVDISNIKYLALHKWFKSIKIVIIIRI
jgi:hypothetical protein